MNIYYDPEKFGLSIFDEIEWSDGCYQFDLTVVWRKVNTNEFFYAEDSGCSCPSPFESMGMDDLIACTPFELDKHLTERFATDWRAPWDQGEADRLTAERGELIMKMRQAVK